MVSFKKNIKEYNDRINEVRSAYKSEGSTYELIVIICEILLDSSEMMSEAHNTKFDRDVKKLNQKCGKVRETLLAEISIKELKVLSKHGITDANWLIANQISINKSEKFDKGSDAIRQKIWDEYIYYLEKGILAGDMLPSTSKRIIFFAKQLVSGLNPDFEKAIEYLNLAIELGNEREAGEAHYNLWCIYLEELNKKQKAKKHLLSAVDLKFPEALAAYGRAHWGNWLGKEDKRKAFSLLQKASKLGSDWGTELLADSYALGLGTRKNSPKAFNLRMELGEDCNGDVCCELAEHHLEGDGTRVNLKEGNKLRKKAIKMGSGRAHWLAANDFQYHSKGNKKRFDILKAAYQLDEPYELTFNDLGDCYFYGHGTKQDFVKARECYERLLLEDCIKSAKAHATIFLEALAGDNPEEELDRILADE